MTPQTTHSLVPPLGAALPEHPELLDSLIYQLNGLVVVFVALGLIWGMLEVVGIYFKQRPQSASRPPAVAPVEPGILADEVSPELTAAIAAAVHVSLEAAHRIASIVPVEPPPLGWAQEGRRQIHSARKVR